ncbi:protein kibra-like isoform X2 [Mustela nigripes]|uniref:protein kibra-like isoform X2 n=1 Tax=Mustela nigripes TaxID=77151 RepID=UPI0028161629|nr:protein kibra-like isoform X2 [Mustela nigripes]
MPWLSDGRRRRRQPREITRKLQPLAFPVHSAQPQTPPSLSRISTTRESAELPLPAGWEEARDYDGRVFYIYRNTRQTSWIDPRDRTWMSEDELWLGVEGGGKGRKPRRMPKAIKGLHFLLSA